MSKFSIVMKNGNENMLLNFRDEFLEWKTVFVVKSSNLSNFGDSFFKNRPPRPKSGSFQMNQSSLLFYHDGFSVNGYKFRTRDQIQNSYWMLKFRNHFDQFEDSCFHDNISYGLKFLILIFFKN